MEEKIRAFICIDFPQEIIKEITRIQSVLKNKLFTGKLTEPENLHLTLKFLGELSPQQLSNVKSALKKIIFPEFEASLAETGTFSFRKSPRIAWIKVGGKQIFQLQKEIDQSLEKLFPKEQRFMSHLTIARIKYVKDKQDFIDYIENLPLKKLKFTVREFKLKSSELLPLGPKYTTIKTYMLTPVDFK